MKIQTEVLIIGGGATGVGISRDLSLRGIPSVLIERVISRRVLLDEIMGFFTAAEGMLSPIQKQHTNASLKIES